jgi:hypothetical protein
MPELLAKAPMQIKPSFVEVHPDTGEPIGEPQSMKTTTSILIQGGILGATTKAFEFRMYINWPPSIDSVSVTPTLAYTNTTLTANPQGWNDADGDPPGYEYQWKKGGVNIGGATSATLTGANFDKNDVITCEVTPWDGTDTGTPRLSNAVTIQNSAPSISSVSVTPTTVYTNTTLTATPSGWSDPDGDPPGYEYQWKKGGVNIGGATSSTLTGANFDKDDVITCEVTPWDGTDTGTPKLSNAVTIQNSAPSILSVSVTPTTAYTNTTLTATPSVWSDADNDPADYQYRWKKSGVNIPGGTSATLTGAYFDKNDVITCEVTPWDGTDTGTPRLSNAVTILDDPRTIDLGAPWTLVGISRQPLDPSTDSIFGDVAVGSIWGWDGAKYVVVTSVEPLQAYWVPTTEPASVQYDCLPLSDPTPDLSHTWNMFAVAEETPVPLPYPNVVGSVWGWDATRYVREETAVQPDQGYWVAAEALAGGQQESSVEFIKPLSDQLLSLDIRFELSEVDKGLLELGLLDVGGAQVLDPAPPASPDGFTFYILGEGAPPFDRLSKLTTPLSEGSARTSWIIVAQVPAGNGLSLSWDGTSIPESVVVTLAKLNVADASLKGGSVDMSDTEQAQVSAAFRSTFAWRVEASCWAPPSKDADGNLIDDEWEQQNCGGTCDPLANPDADWMSNLQEFMAGTNPNDKFSLLAISSIEMSPAGDGIVLSWESVLGRKYQAFRCDSMGGEWYPVGIEIVGTGDLVEVVDTSPDTVHEQFYRVLAW